MKRNLPNFITLLNLLCGSLASISIINNNILEAAVLVFIGAVFDFMDGFVARLFKSQSNLGKELDSLADVVTFGLVPGLMIRYLLLGSLEGVALSSFSIIIISNFGLLITLSSAFRLAKFNIDSRQHNGFIGLPTPANAFFITSLALEKHFQEFEFLDKFLSNPIVLIVIVLLSSWMMNANIRLLALKFKSYSIKGNVLQYGLIAISVVFLILFQHLGISLSIIAYILLSLFLPAKL